MTIDQKSEFAPKSEAQPDSTESGDVWPYERVRSALLQIEGARDLEILRILDEARQDE
jgi:hypothetical protein